MLCIIIDTLPLTIFCMVVTCNGSVGYQLTQNLDFIPKKPPLGSNFLEVINGKENLKNTDFFLGKCVYEFVFFPWFLNN